MLHCTKLNEFNFENEAAVMERIPRTYCCIQDPVHVGTKLRNRLLVASILLALGNRLISVTHLKLLINNVSKDLHGLVMKDICPDDRQNYGSLEKIMLPRVRDALKTNIAGSEGTIAFIRLCANVTSSLCDDDIQPLDRIYRLWFATYVLRAWRKWIIKEQSSSFHYTLRDNFISSNAYLCIEINAANLIFLTRTFREHNMEKLFLPSLFNSQPNEEIFRQFRSMGTVNYTKINFTLLELLHLVGRVELQNDIVHVKLPGKGVFFPRNRMNNANINNYPLPSDDEISSVMEKAKIDAIDEVSKFGMSIEADEVAACEHVHLSILINLKINTHPKMY